MHRLEWDIESLADAMKISQDDVKEYFTDGRRISFLLERRIAAEMLGGRLARSEGDPFDLYDKSGGRWEVRSITKGGVYFSPSRDVGSGRAFSERNLLDKLGNIEGYTTEISRHYRNIAPIQHRN